MSLAGFSKSSGPSGTPRNPTMFGNVSAFPWKPPNSYTKESTDTAPVQQLVQQQQQQHLFPSPERPIVPPNFVGPLKRSSDLSFSAIQPKPSPVGMNGTSVGAENNFLSKPSSLNVFGQIKSPHWSHPGRGFVENHGSIDLIAARPDVSHNNLEQQSISPPSNFLFPQGLDHAMSLSYTQTAGSSTPPKPAYLGAPKRARSPVISMEEPFCSSSAVLESDREIQAKAKRLARFNIEHSHPIQNLRDISRHKPSGGRQNPVPSYPKKPDERAEEAQGAVDGGSFSDLEGAESTNVVVGLCPDMCPESEREERERKGDLDKYERLHGDRNQTSKYLAVKKYNRTAERDAEFIRPLPVLQRTVEYLLNLLDQPYDGSFLNIYNFLWDRMRAIRMDLRMQHIFNAYAIAMLEQMIRLHIIAMHELCEFEKGEGLTEGFDAHLNIEQMNKTSCELFQMYDDHRKRGKTFMSEKEFRGYYALLKLDKHPGYKVEPAELSLHLAKMTPEIRCTREILFARDVARACRIGNYIAFFRLARKATYLQACLMHAHFSKMRKQALASLHSGLQHNQGIPIGHVENWLALEGEDVEGLLDYYGLSIRRYEEAYFVKDGQFLNSDLEFPTRCALLVQSKRSNKIVDDVRCSVVLEEFPVERVCPDDVVDMVEQTNTIDAEMQLDVSDEQMLNSKVICAPINLTEPSKLYDERPAVILNKESGAELPHMSAMNTIISSQVENVYDHTEQDKGQEMLSGDNGISFNGVTLQVHENNELQPVHQSSMSHMIFDDSVTKIPESEHVKNEVLLSSFKQEETTREKLRLILRKWKKHSSLRRENREQKEFLLSTTLSSLSLGPPVCQIQSQQTWSSGNLDIDAIGRARFGKYGNSWSRLNISDVVAPVMATRNPCAIFICWKLVLLVQLSDPDDQADQLASNWLFTKLLGATNRYDSDLVVCSSGLSIWKKWIDSDASCPPTCCLSIVRKVVVEDGLQIVVEKDALHGASCLVYLLSETMPWEIQKARLHNLLHAIPPGSKLPLLVMSPRSTKDEHAIESIDIIDKLALHEADKTRISSFSVIFLADSVRLEYVNGFFDDHQLRVGLQWLAINSPPQPLLHLVQTRELVFGHLRHDMEVTENHKGGGVVEPDHYVAAFNKALDKTAEEIQITALASPILWPAPEVDLLDKSSNEGIMARLCLPSLGWNSPSRVISLVNAIESCKLPGFPDLSWLNHGCLTREQLKKLKLALEELLIIYLNESCKLLKADLAAREVRVMLQHGAALELREAGHFIAPRWNLIFQRIFCWQLNKLTAQEVSRAYVLANKDGFFAMDVTADPDAASQVVSSGVKVYPSMSSLHSNVSLDELIEISCSYPFEKNYLVSIPNTPGTGGEVGGDADFFISSPSNKHPPCTYSHQPMDANTKIAAPLPARNDRFTTLLEQCNRLQDVIDQKLAIYL